MVVVLIVVATGFKNRKDINRNIEKYLKKIKKRKEKYLENQTQFYLEFKSSKYSKFYQRANNL